jgi:predicted acetyltransferase
MTDQLPAPADTYELRAPTSRAELRAYLAPLELAFAEEIPEADWADLEAMTDPARVVAAFDGGAPVGAGGAVPFELTVPGGRMVRAAGVTLVGVSPTHRRRGILRRVIAHLHQDARIRDEPVAVLWASEGAIYQRFGYGPATVQAEAEIDRTGAAFVSPSVPIGQVRIVEPAAAMEVIPPIYERIRQDRPGALSRDDLYWGRSMLADSEQRRQASGRKRLAVLDIDGRAEGYAIYRVKSEWDGRGPKGVLTVLEVVALAARAERELWRWLLDQDLMGSTRIVRGPVPHPLQLLLAEPRRLGLTVGDALWLRILDVQAAMGARRYGRPGTLTVGIQDPSIPSNDGVWVLEVPADAAAGPGSTLSGRLARTDTPPDLSMGIADLAAAYLGGVRIAELARVGRVEEQRPGAVALADAMLASDVSPWCSTGF